MAVFTKKRFLVLTLISLLSISTYYYHSKRSIRLPSDSLKTNCQEQPRKELNEETTVIADGAWTVNCVSRLGNQLGEYSALYALAKMNGRPAYILPQMFNSLAPLFKIRLPQLPSSVVKEIPWKHVYLHSWMTDDYKNITEKYVFFDGTPNSWHYHRQFNDEILREFTFHDHIKNDTNKYLETLKGSRKNVTYIGVHVRRGDYLQMMVISWKGVVADKAYLDKAMHYFREKYQEPVFVVTSNGMQWCKKIINNSRGDVYFAGDGKESSPGRDLALLSHCNHTIMTQGTFGTWAAYLAGGEVIYLTNYTMPDSKLLKILRYEASFLPEWIGIPADLSVRMPKMPEPSIDFH